MVARSDSRNDNKRGMLAEANPTTLYFTLREAFFCCLYLINEDLASILMQHLTLQLQLQLVSVASLIFFVYCQNIVSTFNSCSRHYYLIFFLNKKTWILKTSQIFSTQPQICNTFSYVRHNTFFLTVNQIKTKD